MRLKKNIFDRRLVAHLDVCCSTYWLLNIYAALYPEVSRYSTLVKSMVAITMDYHRKYSDNSFFNWQFSKGLPTSSILL